MNNETATTFEDFLKREKLPPSFMDKLRLHYLPLAQSVAGWRREADGPLLLGVNGAQGTGKSTLAGALALALERLHGLRTAVISIDDLYLTKRERERLGREVHPLLATRGVPGTHDVELGMEVTAALLSGQACAVPRFDKACDDRAPQSEWTRVADSVDVVVFEGWCVGAVPQMAEALEEPVNALEADEDPLGKWRTHVNEALEGAYADLFGRIDKLVMLCPPGFECIRDWRGEQEEKLRQRFLTAGVELPEGIMDAAALKRFIMHYERLTRWMIGEMPARADVVFSMNREREIVETRA